MKKRRAGKRAAGRPSRLPSATGEGTGEGLECGALTPRQRAARGDVVVLEETIEAGRRRVRVLTQTLLDRYRQRGQITERQFDAGERLHRLWRAAGAAQTVVMHYGIRIQGRGDLGERQAALRGDVTRALTKVGTRLASVLVHVCLCDEAAGDWGERHRGRTGDGIAVLRLALDALADYWGLPGEPS